MTSRVCTDVENVDNIFLQPTREGEKDTCGMNEGTSKFESIIWGHHKDISPYSRQRDSICTLHAAQLVSTSMELEITHGNLYHRQQAEFCLQFAHSCSFLAQVNCH